MGNVEVQLFVIASLLQAAQEFVDGVFLHSVSNAQNSWLAGLFEQDDFDETFSNRSVVDMLGKVIQDFLVFCENVLNKVFSLGLEENHNQFRKVSC